IHIRVATDLPPGQTPPEDRCRGSVDSRQSGPEFASIPATTWPMTRPRLLMEPLMLTALILVCSLAAVPDIAACTQDNAVDALHIPVMPANPVTCFMQAQAYLAGPSIGRDLAEGEAVKVVCVRNRAAAAGIAPPTSALLQGE